MTTLYRLATKSDRSAARKLLANGSEPARMGWPVVVALRDGEVVGCLGTHTRRDMIVVGFFKAPSPFVALRLVDAYEAVLSRAGVDRYVFGVESDSTGRWRRALARIDGVVRRYAETNGVEWYERRIA